VCHHCHVCVPAWCICHWSWRVSILCLGQVVCNDTRTANYRANNAAPTFLLGSRPVFVVSDALCASLTPKPVSTKPYVPDGCAIDSWLCDGVAVRRHREWLTLPVCGGGVCVWMCI
jgi:hypothetical protein